MDGNWEAQVYSVCRIAVLLMGVTLIPAIASAQSESEFIAAFSGNWQVFDDSFASGGALCGLALGKSGKDGRYDLVKANCGQELAKVDKWGIVDKQLAFLDVGGLVLVRLGGNQRRMTGTTASNKPVVFDRMGEDGLASQLQAAVKAAGCYYLGFTDRCAPPAELANPFAATGAANQKVEVIVNLNVRAEPRDNADAVGVVPRNSCIVVDTCLTASDGVWCQAKFGERTGWMRKVALRQNRWPVVTFLNRCDQVSQ